MSQLTKQIAAAYIGAQVHVRIAHPEIEGHPEYTGEIVAPYIGTIMYKSGSVLGEVTYDQCRLILTPLSHITDEDAVEVCNIVGERGAGNGKILRVIITVDLKIVLDFEKTRFSIPLSISIIDYLRSRNYDLGYMGIKSLIDAGIAISSTDKTDSDVQP